jgi:hypothetical protein
LIAGGCGRTTKKQSEEQADENTLSFRPRENIQRGKIYTDTLGCDGIYDPDDKDNLWKWGDRPNPENFVSFNWGGDVYFFVIPSAEERNKLTQLNYEDVVEIQWKMDDVWFENPDYGALTAISIKKIASRDNPNNESSETVNKNLLEETIIKTIKAYQNKDEKTLNDLILKDFGIAFVHRSGAIDDVIFSNQILFDNPVPDYYPYDIDIKTDYKINFEELPEFNCDTEEWNKPSGIYCDTINRIEPLSSIAQYRENFSYDEIVKLGEIERASHKIIVLGKLGNYFKFFLTFRNNKWYLTVIDRTDYCSA